ncbi:MAG: PEP/pyruvate-binding domain-containing protein [Candidatus Nanohaloarchaea archaeon]
MVEWKGEVTEENSGRKAALLDSIESNNVPNFFVITKEEVQAYVGNSTDPERIKNNEIPDEVEDKIEEAYNEIGISSEVREASGRAKNLVGGQRNNQKVSVRVSDSEKPGYDYLLNVGKKDLDEAIKDVISSYYEKNSSGYPAIIIQKMVEPEYTGAVITDYLGNHGLVETVEGLGISLETGITKPEFYLIQDNEVNQISTPEEQVKVTLHPLNNEHRTKKVLRDEPAFEQEELQNFYQKIDREEVNVKFVYKRGTFYIVDVFEAEESNPFSENEPGLNAVRVSEGEISGDAGTEVTVSEETLHPSQYNQLIAFKGGYTSTDAQKARRQGKPAIFSASNTIKEGEYVEVPENQVEIQKGGESSAIEYGVNQETSEASKIEEVTAIEVLPIDKGERTIDLSPPYSKGYSIADRQVPGENLSSKSYISSYKDVLKTDQDKIVLDTRKLDKEAVNEALEYLDSEQLILLLDKPRRKIIRKAVSTGVDVVGVNPSKLEKTEKIVAEEEKKFILDSLRNQEN